MALDGSHLITRTLKRARAQPLRAKGRAQYVDRSTIERSAHVAISNSNWTDKHCSIHEDSQIVPTLVSSRETHCNAIETPIDRSLTLDRTDQAENSGSSFPPPLAPGTHRPESVKGELVASGSNITIRLTSSEGIADLGIRSGELSGIVI